MYVLLPGAGGDSWYWHLIAPRLRTQGHEVVAVDLPAGDDSAGLSEYADATVDAIENHVINADLVIGAVLVPGAAAPKIVTHEMMKRMRPGSVLVDIAIDQGGCFETSRATTHADPTFVVDGVVHYCVANMPGAVARTSAFALNNATLPFALKLANLGPDAAMKADPHLANGLNVSNGKIRHQAVAEALGLPFEAA